MAASVLLTDNTAPNVKTRLFRAGLAGMESMNFLTESVGGEKNFTDVSLFDLFDIFLRTCQHKTLCENSMEENANILWLSCGGLSC